MQTSEKLHRQKHEKELNSRIDDTIFELKRVKNDIKILCDDLKSLNNSFTTFQKEVNNKFKLVRLLWDKTSLSTKLRWVINSQLPNDTQFF